VFPLTRAIVLHFGISLFVFIDFYFILFMCCWCFPLRCLFQCLFVCLFVLLFYFVFIPFLYLCIVYVMWLYFVNFSLKVYVALKWDYHILFVYWLIVYIVFLKIYRNIVCIIQTTTTKCEAKNKQTISKFEKQQTEKRKQNTKIYQTWIK
jgi:hypothetical protein